MKTEEEKIIKLMSAKNLQALEILYDHHASLLFGFIRENIQKEEEAELVLKETFNRIWQNFTQFDSNRDRLVTWMINICRTLILEKKLIKNISGQNNNQDNEWNVSGNISGASYNPGVIGKNEIVKRLEPEYYKIIDLLYMKGNTLSEVAEKLNIPLGTVKTRSNAAVQKLKTIFPESRIAG